MDEGKGHLDRVNEFRVCLEEAGFPGIEVLDKAGAGLGKSFFAKEFKDRVENGCFNIEIGNLFIGMDTEDYVALFFPQGRFQGHEYSCLKMYFNFGAQI